MSTNTKLPQEIVVEYSDVATLVTRSANIVGDEKKDILLRNALILTLDAYLVSKNKKADRLLSRMLSKTTSLSNFNLISVLCRLRNLKLTIENFNLGVGLSSYIISDFINKLPKKTHGTKRKHR